MKNTILYNPELKRWANPKYTTAIAGKDGWIEVEKMGKTTPLTPSTPLEPLDLKTDQIEKPLSPPPPPSPSPPPPDVLGEIPAPPAPPPVQRVDTIGMQKQLEEAQKRIDDIFQKQTETIAKQKKVLEEELKKYEIKGEEIIKEIEPLSKPFREQLESVERARLKVEENYFANQRLTEELSGLLTELNTLQTTGQELLRTGAISRTKYEKDKEELLGRAGIIQAVMSARNDQIGKAYSLIDRTVNAIVADRQSRAGYLNSLLEFYNNLKTATGEKIKILTSEQQKYIDLLIKQEKERIASIRKNVEYIKQKMIDPSTAQAFADAGVSLTDDEQTISEKLSNFFYMKEIKKTTEDMAKDEWTLLMIGEKTPAGARVSKVVDSRGREWTFYKKEKTGRQWSEPYSLGGDIVQRDLTTGEIKKVVDVSKGVVADTDKILSIEEIQRFKKNYGWTPPYGFTKAQLLQFIKDNPNASPQELERGAKNAFAILYGKETKLEIKPKTTFVETVGHIMNTSTKQQKDLLHRKAAAAGYTKLFRSKWSDIKAYVESLKDKIEEAIEQGYTAEEIKNAIINL